MRTKREWFPGSIYHVMARGNYRQNIVQDNADRICFMNMMQYCIRKYDGTLHAFVLMDNHYHWLLQTGNVPIWELMHSFGWSYSTYYNQKYEKSGHLFQNRYKSCIVKAEPYFLQTSRYIHLNPVKAGMVSSPEQYRWSSYRTYMGIENLPYICTERIFSFFDANKAAEYRKFTEQKLSENEFEKIRIEIGEDES